MPNTSASCTHSGRRGSCSTRVGKSSQGKSDALVRGGYRRSIGLEAMVYRSDQSVNWKILTGGTAERPTVLTCSGKRKGRHGIDILVVAAHRTEVAGTSRSDDNILLAVAPQIGNGCGLA